jgi:hypothetical protein
MSVSVEQLRLLGKISSIKQRRSSKISPVSVLNASSASEMFPEGTCTIVISERKFVDRISRLGSRDLDDTKVVAEIGAQLSELNKSKPNGDVSDVEALRKVLDTEKNCEMFDLHFNGSPILISVPLLNSFGIGAVTIPYSGGQLDASSFKLEHFNSGSDDEDWCGTIIPIPPKLSEIERKVLDLIPSNVGNVTLGDVGTRAVTVTTVTIALFVVAVHCPAYGGAMRRIKALSDVTDKLGPDLQQFQNMLENGDVLPAAQAMLEVRARAFT